MATETKRLMCHECPRVECRLEYPRGIPDYCEANTFPQVLEETKSEYQAPGTYDIYRAAGKVVANGYLKWPRVKEAIEFCKELGVSKVGFASCVALRQELRDLAKLFQGAGFEVISASCQIGRVHPHERGVPQEHTDFRGLFCNPIAQAEILNQEGTEINFILGLCLGHDILFNKYSKAPVSTLIVKDRVTGDNPSVALHNSFHRQRLWKDYCGKEID